MITLTRHQIVHSALALVGRPFRHHGRDPKFGLDCAGLLVATFAPLGVTLAEGPRDYRAKPPEAYVTQCLAQNFRLIESPPAAGDIVHLRYKRDTEARHVGIIADAGELLIIHAVRHQPVTLEPLYAVLAKTELKATYQWPFLSPS